VYSFIWQILVVFTLFTLCDNVGLTGFVKREIVPVFGFMSANPFVSLREIGRNDLI